MVQHRRRWLELLLLLSAHALSVRAFENPFSAWTGDTEHEIERAQELSHNSYDATERDDDAPSFAFVRALAAGGDDDDEDADTINRDNTEDALSDASAHVVEDISEHEPELPVHAQETILSEDADDERRLTEANPARDDEPNEYAALAGIDLSPFHMYQADKAVLVRLVDWAYDRAAYFSRFQDGYVHAEELGRLFSLALNPMDVDVPIEYLDLIEAAAAEMRAVQGLLDDAMAVPRGFIGRGMPLRALQQLAEQMHAFHTSVQQRRRLVARDSSSARASEL